jgi:hypothetical protein
LGQPGVRVDPEAILFKLVAFGPVTDDGRSVSAVLGATIEDLTHSLFVAEPSNPLESALGSGGTVRPGGVGSSTQLL